MTVSPDAVFALQRHFLGALSAPSRTWLEPVPATRLAFAGTALRRSGAECVLDFGTIDLPGEECRTVRVFQPGHDRVDIRLGGLPPWLEGRWIEKDVLELLARPETESELRGSLRLVVDESRVEELGVRVTARRLHPVARFDFNGSTVPRPFQFVSGEHPYQFSVANDASVPLIVSFADLPAWLTFEVDGQRRSGPLPGRFFERTAPFTVQLRPQFFGLHNGALRIRSNDPRPELQTVDVRFTSYVVPERPFVRALPPAGVRLRADQTLTAEATLENWGRTPARTAKRATTRGVALPALPVVPAARDGSPGSARLPIRIAGPQFAPGTYEIPLSLRIEQGEPAEVHLTARIEVEPAVAHPTPVRAALLAVLLLTLVLLVLRELP